MLGSYMDGFDLAPGKPDVLSSFYPSPNGVTSIRAYEIVNSNPNISKIRKDELDEPRFENTLSRAFLKFKNLFVSTEDSSYGMQRRYPRQTNDLNVRKGVSFHTKKDGSVIAVTSLDLNKHNGDNTALKEFVQKKALMDKHSNNYTSPNPPVVQVQPQPRKVLIKPVNNMQNMIMRANANIQAQALAIQRPVVTAYGGSVSPCLCLECQSRRARVNNSFATFPCNCLDCQTKGKHF